MAPRPATDQAMRKREEPTHVIPPTLRVVVAMCATCTPRESLEGTWIMDGAMSAPIGGGWYAQKNLVAGISLYVEPEYIGGVIGRRGVCGVSSI